MRKGHLGICDSNDRLYVVWHVSEIKRKANNKKWRTAA